MNKNDINLIYKIAKKNNIIINNKHLFIIKYVKKFFLEYNLSPSIKMIIFYINKNTNKKINIKYINNIFKDLNNIYILSNIRPNKNCLI